MKATKRLSPQESFPYRTYLTFARPDPAKIKGLREISGYDPRALLRVLRSCAVRCR